MREPLTVEELANLKAKDEELFWERRRGSWWVKRMTADWQTPTDEELTIHRLLATLDAAREGLDVVYAAVRPEFREQGAGSNDPMPSADQRAREAAERIYARLVEAQQREGAGS